MDIDLYKNYRKKKRWRRTQLRYQMLIMKEIFSMLNKMLVISMDPLRQKLVKNLLRASHPIVSPAWKKMAARCKCSAIKHNHMQSKSKMSRRVMKATNQQILTIKICLIWLRAKRDLTSNPIIISMKKMNELSVAK